ncbi:MAG: hypothetical protein PsegKO_27560 [Pseudohongiellaceae bacterium]|jgi:uncharacterized tellurite resistance protein B-like protein
MSLINFSAIRELVGSGTAKHKQELFQETMLMVLARATRVDSNVESVEVAQVKAALKEHTGVDFSDADIRTAASSEIFASQSLERYLTSATRKLSESERVAVLDALASIIRSDEEIRYTELDFFDRVATSLRATPSEIAGLLASGNS